MSVSAPAPAPDDALPRVRPGHDATARATHDDTRARILDVALELFAEKGFAGTSTREISERLGFTKAALYYHFRTKDDLLEALLAPGFEGLSSLVDDSTTQTSASARRAILATYIDLVAAHESVIRVLTHDPSTANRPVLIRHKQLFERLTCLLAGDEAPGVAQQTRVRAALGGIGAALLHANPTDDPQVVKAATLAAACGALGIPAPR